MILRIALDEFCLFLLIFCNAAFLEIMGKKSKLKNARGDLITSAGPLAQQIETSGVVTGRSQAREKTKRKRDEDKKEVGNFLYNFFIFCSMCLMIYQLKFYPKLVNN